MPSLMDLFSGNYQLTAADQQRMSGLGGGQEQQIQTDWGSRDMSNLDSAPTDQAGMASWQDYQAKNNSPMQNSVWDLSNFGATTPQTNAPTYNAGGLTNLEGGRVGYSGNDPALLATLTAGNQGALTYGVNAFGVGNGYDSLRNLAQQTGFDASGYGTAKDLRYALDDHLKDYYAVGGLSQGWNDTGDVRGATGGLYRRVDGQLVPIQTKDYHAREEGGWLQEHPGILAPIAVATGGLASAYMGGAGAAGAGAGGATGTAGTAGAVGTAGAGSTGISGTIANALGLGSQWGALPAWGQGAISNAVMGGLNSGIRGGNILEGALMGGLTGGVGGGITSGLTGAGMNSALAGGLGRLGGSLVGGAVQGGNLGSILQNSALSTGAGMLGNQLGFNAPITDNSLGAILARMAAQQGGSYLAGRIDPRLSGLGGQGLAALYNRYS